MWQTARVTLAGASILALACQACGASDEEPTASPPASTYVAGSRLSVEYWEYGTLAVPRRFWDSSFDQPCEIEILDDTTCCVPYTDNPQTIGFTDEQCSEPVIAATPEAALEEGDAVVFVRYPSFRAYRVGAAIEDGPVYVNETACQVPGEVGIPTGVVPRRQLVPISASELVRFERQRAELTSALTAVILHGTDGAEFIDHVEAALDVICWIAGDYCVPGTEVAEAAWFTRRFLDSGCTQPAIHSGSGSTTQCGAKGMLLIGNDECSQPSFLGTIGAQTSAPGYLETPAGACEPSSATSLAPSECLQQVVPPAASVPRFESEELADGPLGVRSLRAGGSVVRSGFRLEDGITPCVPARGSDGEIRCLPVGHVNAATQESGIHGAYSDVDCAGTPSLPSPMLYTFKSGEPCWSSAATDPSGSTDGKFGDLPEVSGVERFVPHQGPVFLHNAFVEPPQCSELPAAGFYITESVELDLYPLLTSRVH